MDGFISQIARRLYEKYGDEISSLYFLFPSRRARLFFADAVSAMTERPLWQPDYLSIDDMMEDISGLKTGDRIRLITELYKVYSKYHKEEFDGFYFWGEMLLADFDSIDKYLIDADMLFSNMLDLKEIESDLSYLTQEQAAIVSQFWRNFGTGSGFSEEKERFFSVWKTLAPIYHEYKQRLSSLGFAYTGMIHRAAADRIKTGDTQPYDRHYVVAGFNAVSECEKILFDHLSRTGDVDFFWDYDNYYVKDENQEAGLFLRDNIVRFPQRESLPYDNNGFSGEKEIVVVSAPSNSLQCKYVAEFLSDIDSPDKETAVVLTDENLLMPVLYSVPESVDSVNITMGYPLRQTLVYSFLERLIELHSHSRVRGGRVSFYHASVTGLLAHPFLKEHDEVLAGEIERRVTQRRQIYVEEGKLSGEGLFGRVFRSVGTWRELAEYIVEVLSEVARRPYGGADRGQRMEFLSITVENIRMLGNSLENCDVELTVGVYTSLLRRMLQSVRVPFEGEPLEGVQVMGILETRNLDFENVVVLSVNDDTFPGNRAVSSSFIPYNLRLAYGLPTPAHHEGVYAYYFYRLMQRAKRVHLVYCSRSDDKSTGEASRYIHQLRYESGHRIEDRRMALDINLEPVSPIVEEKNGEIMKKLENFLDGGPAIISPTSLYAYIECPLKFYFRSVARLRVEENFNEDIDAPVFGNILHKAMEIIYAPLVGHGDPRMEIRELIGAREVEDAVSMAVKEVYLRGDDVDADGCGGDLALVRDVVEKYINACVLPFDAGGGEFRIMELEKEIGCEFGFEVGKTAHTVRFDGMADRMDVMADGAVRVVDYKTGRMNMEFDGMDALFCQDRRRRSPAVLQTFVYAMMIDRRQGGSVTPALYYVRNMNADDYSPLLLDTSKGVRVHDYAGYRDGLETHLRTLLGEMFDPQRPFVQTDDAQVCEWCDYRRICRR